MSRTSINPLETISWTVLAFLLLGGVAKADITVCNDFRAPIHVVFAYPDRDDFTATGWWNVGPNSCQTADFVFQGNDLYYAADSDDYNDGRFSKHDHWGNKVKLFVNKHTSSPTTQSTAGVVRKPRCSVSSRCRSRTRRPPQKSRFISCRERHR